MPSSDCDSVTSVDEMLWSPGRISYSWEVMGILWAKGDVWLWSAEFLLALSGKCFLGARHTSSLSWKDDVMCCAHDYRFKSPSLIYSPKCFCVWLSTLWCAMEDTTSVLDRGKIDSVMDKLTRNIHMQLRKCRCENKKARLCYRNIIMNWMGGIHPRCCRKSWKMIG